jgi:hypothetical protein
MDVLRKVIAAGIALRGLTNFGKPFAPESALLWRAHPAARPLAIAYAVWATVNVVLFPLIEGVPAAFEPWMYVAFAVPGIVIPWLAVWTLRRP